MRRHLVIVLALSITLWPLVVPDAQAANRAGALSGTRQSGAPARLSTLSPGVQPSTPAVDTHPAPEVISLRTQNSRTYQGNGFYTTTIAPGSLNYRDRQGAWQPIDDTLVPATTPGYAYQNQANRYTVSFPADLGQAPILVTTPSGSVQFQLSGGSSTGTVSGNTITYPLSGGSIAFTAGNDELKESITLAGPTSPSTFSYRLTTSGGLTARQTSRGGIDLIDGSGTRQLGFVAPFMQDSAAAPAAISHAVHLTLASGASGQTVTLTADPSWLGASVRHYPVVIDPTLTLSGANQDCWLESGIDASDTQCGSPTLNMGYDGTGYERSLLQFNVQNSIPSQAIVLNADLALDDYTNLNATSIPTSLSQLTHAWTDVATWNSYDGTHAWTTPGGDFNGTAAASNSSGVGASTGWFHWYPTQLVQGWVNGTIPNDGLLLKETTEPVNNRASFYSSESSTSADWPTLTVVYAYMTGDQPWYTTDMGVNVANGNLLFGHQDLAMPGVGLPLSLERTYNNLSPITNHMGNGWVMSLGRDEQLQLFADGSVAYYGSTGEVMPFIKQASGSFLSPPGADADLVKNGDGTYTLTGHVSGVKERFDGNGYLTAVVDRSGNTISLSYDNNALLTAITDTLGHSTSFGYNLSTHDLTSMTDAAGRVYQYGHDSIHNLTSVTDPAGKVTSYSYLPSGNLGQITDANGNETTFGYDSQGRVTSITRVTNNSTGTGYTTTFTYHTGNTVVTDPNNHTTTYAYDAYGRVTSITYPDSTSSQTTWTADNHVASAVSPKHETTTYSYDANNNLTSVQLPTGPTFSWHYANSSFPYQPSSSVDEEGRTTSYGYTTQGLVNSVTDAANHSQSFTYNTNGTLASGTDANTHTTSYGYTGGLLTSVTHPSPLGSEAGTYNSAQLSDTATDGKGQTTVSSYDGLGRLTGATYSDGSQTVYGYDATGNLTSQADVPTGATNLLQNGGFESSPPSAPPWSGAAAVTGNAHSGSYSDQLNASSSNASSLLSQTFSVPSGTGKLTLTYWLKASATNQSAISCSELTVGLKTSGGTLIATLPNPCIQSDNGSYRQYVLDLTTALAGYRGQQVQLSLQSQYDGTTSTTFWLDDVSLTNVQGTTYSYNRLDQLTQKTLPNGHTMTYVWDGVGNLLSMTDGGGTVTYGYNQNDQVTSVTDPQNHQTTFGYDDNGNRTTITYPTSPTQVVETMAYDASQQLTSITASGCSSGTCPQFSYSYANPTTNQQTTTRYSMTDAAGNVTSYSYDALLELTQAVQKTSGGSQLASYAYAYDPVGNLTAKTINGSQTSMSYNAADELCWSYAGSSTNGCSSPPTGASPYTYDANGNGLTGPTISSSVYNAQDQTTSMTPSGGSAIPLTYLGAGQTQRSGNGTTSYEYDGGEVSSSSSGGYATSYTRDPEGNLISERIPNGAGGCTTTPVCTYYYLFDGLGSVVAVVDSSGVVKDSYSYDPYGNATASEPVPNPFRFARAVWDSQTHLYKMGERYYDPSIGRFTQVDPLGGGYGYANDNPANEIDPTGLCPVCVAPAAVGLAIPGVGEVLLGAAVFVGVGIAAYQIYHAATRTGGSGEERSHFPRYSSKKRAYGAAKRASARGRQPEHDPSDPYGPHYHAVNSKGKRRSPNVHYKYPPFK